MSRIFAVLAFAHTCAAGAATIDVFGVTFDPDNGITQASIITGGYTTPHGAGLFSGGSDDWLPPDAAGRSLGTYFQLPTFQPGYDPGAPRLGNPGSSVTLGSYLPDATNVRDVISVKWAPGMGAYNGAGKDVAVFEKATSEAYAIRAHNATTGTWGPWYYEIFNALNGDLATPTEYELTDLGVAPGQVVDEIWIQNLAPEDTVATSIYDYPTAEFDGIPGLDALGFGIVTFGGGTGFAPARRSSSSTAAFFEAGKYDPDIAFVVALDSVVAAPAIVTPLPPAMLLLLPAALGVLFTGRRRASRAQVGTDRVVV